MGAPGFPRRPPTVSPGRGEPRRVGRPRGTGSPSGMKGRDQAFLLFLLIGNHFLSGIWPVRPPPRHPQPGRGPSTNSGPGCRLPTAAVPGHGRRLLFSEKTKPGREVRLRQPPGLKRGVPLRATFCKEGAEVEVEGAEESGHLLPPAPS